MCQNATTFHVSFYDIHFMFNISIIFGRYKNAFACSLYQLEFKGIRRFSRNEGDESKAIDYSLPLYGEE